ncbi:hypothetical protein Ddye_002588 [Dipteronia dyeriana]|uniref:pectinesterase n=1 Tax=Dipteronia dyeriana TaxID=168575 RepID=A0AAE0CUL9_9ROSI|nr:hypothetical protein Ddye_002588 [Dipteronia dyeriana]
MMDSINIIKGYNKVNHTHENQPPPLPPPPHKSSTTTNTQKRISTAATVAAILFLTFFIGLMLAALIHESATEPPESSSLSSNSAESIRTVCGVTQYPDSCFTSISSLNNNNLSLISQKNPDPETIFKLSLRVTINELTKVSSLFKTLNERHSEVALRDCTSQFEDAVSRLNDSMSEMEVVGPGEKMLTERKVNDIQTWISAAMTDQETCLDGLEEMGSTAVDEVKANLKKSKEFLSNSLAIIAKIHMLLRKFDLTMH